MKINDLNNSIESRKNFKEINYIKKPIHKIINCKISKLNREFLEENNNKNKDIKKENEKIIKEIEYININNEIDASFYIIQKDCNFCRYKKYYQFYLRLPIKKNCYLQKIRKHKLIKQNKEFSNNNINGYQLTKNHRKNLILDFFKNGKDDIKEKNISNSYSKNISNFRNENFEVNEIFLFSNNETKFLRKENQDENSKTRSITEEKFAMGCSKLNKILTKNSKINFIVNGLRIAQINSKDNNSKREEEQNRELSANNISEKENGGVENIYKINNSFSKSSETKKNLKGLHYEIKNLLSNNDTSETNESHNHSKHIIIEQNNSNEVLNKNKSEDYFNNIPPNKKPKSKKKSNSKRKKNSSNEKKEINKTLIFDKYVYEQISQDLENFLKFEKNEKVQNEKKEIVDTNNIYNWEIIEKLMLDGKAKLEDIIQVYIEIVKNQKFFKENIKDVHQYIKSIIEYYISDLSNNQIEIVHLNMIELFKSVFEFKKNETFCEIIGNLLFILLKYKLYYMKDLNYFIDSEKEIQINIAKIVRFSILSSGKFIKQYHNDFKFTKLFNNNKIFVNFVTNEISELKKKI